MHTTTRPFKARSCIESLFAGTLCAHSPPFQKVRSYIARVARLFSEFNSYNVTCLSANSIGSQTACPSARDYECQHYEAIRYASSKSS
jgi:hypothetical protein